METRHVCKAVVCLLVALFFWPVGATDLSRPRSNVMVGDNPADPSPRPQPITDPIDMSDNPEVFRQQLLGLLDELEESLELAAKVPLTKAESARLASLLAGYDAQAARLREGLRELHPEELIEMRGVMLQIPEVLAIPKILNANLTTVMELQKNEGEDRCVGGEALDEVAFGLKVLVRVLTHPKIGADIGAGILSNCPDPTHVCASGAIIFVTVKGILEFLINVVETGILITEFVEAKREECLAGTCAVEINRGVTLQCYADAAAAVDSSERATVASPETCSDLQVTSAVVDSCNVRIEATATDPDDADNVGADSVVVAVDSTPPTIVIEPGVSDACYASLAQGEQAIRAASTIEDDCSRPDEVVVTTRSSVSTCSLRVRTEAVDLCGNSASDSATVRVDGRIPDVRIERALLADRGGLACFADREQAESAVLRATRFSDDCTPTEALVRTTGAEGPQCDLLVTSSATDECGNANTDTFEVRVDRERPSVSCATAVRTIASSNGEMVDVGFSFATSDNCLETTVDITVTSDEPTATATGSHGPHSTPDAVILRDGDGAVQGILMRAEASSQGDGRVYRIRVVSTDACGLESQADCLVGVPRNPSTPAVNSGQFFDATATN